MIETKSTERSDRHEKAILVKVLLSDGEYSAEDPLEEIRGLAKTAGLVVAGGMLQKRHQVDIAHLYRFRQGRGTQGTGPGP